MTPQQRRSYGIKCRKAREAMKVPKGAIASKLGQPTYLIERIEIGEFVLWHENVYKKLEEVLGLTSCDETSPPVSKPSPSKAVSAQSPSA
jgi:ribosome-binding protein aMBF1 (putative translation factor)